MNEIVRLNSIDRIKRLAALTEAAGLRVTASDGSNTADAEDVLGMIGLDLNSPISLHCVGERSKIEQMLALLRQEQEEGDSE